MAAVSVLIKPASGLCNMTCDYCFYCDESRKREHASYGMMTEETLRNIIVRAMNSASGEISFAFQGGEPSLRGLDFFRRAVEFEKQFNHKGLRVSNAFQTNGFSLDEEWCRFFKEYNFLVGLSVDGTKELHDRCRHDKKGNGTFESVERTAALFDRFGVEYNILTVVTKDLAEQVDNVYREYKARGWRYQQYIACLAPLNEKRGEDPWSLSSEQYGKFLCRLFALWYKDWRSGRAPYIRRFENYIAIMLGYPPESCEQGGVCGIQLVAEADGSIYPCDFYVLDEYCLGNLNRNRFSDLDRRRKEIGFIERSSRLDPACKKCMWFQLCRGGCQRNREIIPETDTYRNYYCEAYKQFFETSYERMREIARSVSEKRNTLGHGPLRAHVGPPLNRNNPNVS